jgi:hypothetical protein
MVKLAADPDRFPQTPAPDQQPTHHTERAGFDRAAAEQPEFIARCLRDNRDQFRKLILRHSGARFPEIFRVCAGASQHPVDIVAGLTHATQNQTDIAGIDG